MLHSGNNLVEGIFSLEVLEELVGKAGGIIDEGIIGAPMKNLLKRATKCDAVGVFVHAIKQDRANENPGGWSRTASLTLAVNRRVGRRVVEGFREPESGLELMLDALEVGSLHHAGAFGTAEAHAGEHGKAAEDAVVACFCVVIEGGENSFGETGKIIGDGFNK